MQVRPSGWRVEKKAEQKPIDVCQDLAIQDCSSIQRQILVSIQDLCFTSQLLVMMNDEPEKGYVSPETVQAINRQLLIVDCTYSRVPIWEIAFLSLNNEDSFC